MKVNWKQFDRNYRVRCRKVVQSGRKPFWVYYTYKVSPALFSPFQYLGNGDTFSLIKWGQLQAMVLMFAFWYHAPHSYRVKHTEQYQRWQEGL